MNWHRVFGPPANSQHDYEVKGIATIRSHSDREFCRNGRVVLLDTISGFDSVIALEA